jgi:hypothetical protein
MDFTKFTIDKKLNTSNQDYDIEFWWYGFKNLLKNYFNNLKINNNPIDTNILELSSKLNQLQSEQKYLEIYTQIYDFIMLFLNTLINEKTDITKYYYDLIITWLKRYNNIDYVKKISLLNTYTGRNIKEINDKELTIIKFYIKYSTKEYNENVNLVDLFGKDFNQFMDYCIDKELLKIIGIFTTTYNLQDYYDYRKISKKFIPIKPNKFISFFIKI